MSHTDPTMFDRGTYRFPGRILVATGAYPPIPGGSSVIMRNLLDSISPESIVLARSRPLKRHTGGKAGHHLPHFVINSTTLPSRFERYRQLILRKAVTGRIVRLAERTRCRAILGVYPTILFLDVAERAARTLRVPFVPYLHDTVEEGMAAGKFARWGRRAQERVFASAKRVFVATGGMAELYRRKYNLDVEPILHIYPEPIPGCVPDERNVQKTLFWGGAVYGINAKALLRVHQALTRADRAHSLLLATGQTRDQIEDQGFAAAQLDTTFVPLAERSRYLGLLREQKILVLALNWPDETRIHEDELSTIFPTKAPEYLASGRPILVHCPEHYYLAKFFRENDCGEVVTSRDPVELDAAVIKLLRSQEERRRLGQSGLEAAAVFSRDAVLPKFLKALEAAIERRGAGD